MSPTTFPMNVAQLQSLQCLRDELYETDQLCDRSLYEFLGLVKSLEDAHERHLERMEQLRRETDEWVETTKEEMDAMMEQARALDIVPDTNEEQKGGAA